MDVGTGGMETVHDLDRVGMLLLFVADKREANWVELMACCSDAWLELVGRWTGLGYACS